VGGIHECLELKQLGKTSSLELVFSSSKVFMPPYLNHSFASVFHTIRTMLRLPVQRPSLARLVRVFQDQGGTLTTHLHICISPLARAPWSLACARLHAATLSRRISWISIVKAIKTEAMSRHFRPAISVRRLIEYFPYSSCLRPVTVQDSRAASWTNQSQPW
jgi:hypothetical protein